MTMKCQCLLFLSILFTNCLFAIPFGKPVYLAFHNQFQGVGISTSSLATWHPSESGGDDDDDVVISLSF